MQCKSMLMALSLVLPVLSYDANASFVHTDWKTAGDAQATLDSSTGLEWLKLNNTAGKSLATVRAEIDTLYEGWRLPTEVEVMQLFRNLLGNNYAYVEGEAATQRNFVMPTEMRAIARAFLGDSGGGTAYGWYMLQSIPNSIGGSGLWINGHWYNWTYSLTQGGRGGTGVFLVSDGGATLSSINNPNLNINNPNAPVNQGGVTSPADVSGVAGFGFLGLLLAGFGWMRKVKRGRYA